jgi:hypothetical protein
MKIRTFLDRRPWADHKIRPRYSSSIREVASVAGKENTEHISHHYKSLAQ